MIYDKRHFGYELLMLLDSRADVSKIAAWASEVYHAQELDEETSSLAYDLMVIDDGPEFEMSRDELIAIVKDCLLSGLE